MKEINLREFYHQIRSEEQCPRYWKFTIKILKALKSLSIKKSNYISLIQHVPSIVFGHIIYIISRLYVHLIINLLICWIKTFLWFVNSFNFFVFIIWILWWLNHLKKTELVSMLLIPHGLILLIFMEIK